MVRRTMSESKTYTGGCHCGKVRYEVSTDLARLTTCNCSICSKRGHVMTFVGGDAFKLLSGEGELTDYQFNKKNVHHLFCKTCGIESFARGTGKNGESHYMISVRCLDGADLAGRDIPEFDGKKL
jgi:hypothetical protein